jgi:hypothetical protein
LGISVDGVSAGFSEGRSVGGGVGAVPYSPLLIPVNSFLRVITRCQANVPVISVEAAATTVTSHVIALLKHFIVIAAHLLCLTK